MQNLIKRQLEYINITQKKKKMQIHEILQFFVLAKKKKILIRDKVEIKNAYMGIIK